jgi:hypothetical protein
MRPPSSRRPLRSAALLLAVAALVVGTPSPGQAAGEIRFLQANIGNVNVAPGACNDQAVKLCLAPVEQRLAVRLAELQPDVVALQEVLPTLVCEPPASPGAFGTPATSLSLLNPDHLCSPQQRAAASAPEQRDRLLPPREWDVRCNAPNIDPAAPERVIPPWDCVGVRRSAGRIADFRTLPGSRPGVVPDETCDNGFTVNVARLVVRGAPLQVTSAHPDSGGARDGCRAEKLSRMFAALGGSRPTAPTIVAGDMNLDPYRTSDASTEVWSRHVGTEGTPYRYRSGIAEADPAPFTSNICGPSQEDPTGRLLDVVDVPAPPCASTLDHVATTPDVSGPCDTLGEAPGASARIDGGGGMDHRGIACAFTVRAAAAAAPPPPRAAPAPVQPAPVGAAPGELPATGGHPAPWAAAAVAGALGLAALRRRQVLRD